MRSNQKGYKADFIVLDKDLDLRATYLADKKPGKRNRLKVEFTVVDSAFLIFTRHPITFVLK